MADIKLTLSTVIVQFSDGAQGQATAEGNNAAWVCACGTMPPLLGRCYFQFGHDCRTVCPACGRQYRVLADASKRTREVIGL